MQPNQTPRQARISPRPDPAIPAAPVTAVYEAALQPGPPSVVGIVRRLSSGGEPLCQVLDCHWEFEDPDEADSHHRWLRDNVDRLPRLSHLSRISDPAIALAIVTDGVEQRRRAEHEEEILAAMRVEQVSRLYLQIEAATVKRAGVFGVDLKRGSEIEPFWRIEFDERWERDRFHDWFRWQDHRFAEWATFVEGRPGSELEHLLLAEMLATERRIKAAGLGAGGRRPLRFYRGDR